MSYTLTYLQKNNKECKGLLGISYENLVKLIDLGKHLEKKHQEKIEQKTKRLIRPGGGA